jgi:molybdenum cofactor biosynthesis enzyme MoaA
MTEGCNLACQHCWVTPALMGNRATGGHVSAERLLRACRDARAVGLGAVKLTGGEPLLHPEFGPLVYGMRALGLKVWMESNLTLLTRRRRSRSATMTFLSTSIDAATEAEHDAFRGSGASGDL